MRKFEVVKRLNEDDVKLPVRSTKNSAGYDFYAVEDMIIYPVCHSVSEDKFVIHENHAPYLVSTGIKAKMLDDEFLMLCNRSSNPRRGLILANGVGIVDSDYYGNKDSDGEIMFPFINIGKDNVHIKKGDKIGQGIFMKYETTDDDNANGERTGGFGSTGK